MRSGSEACITHDAGAAKGHLWHLDVEHHLQENVVDTRDDLGQWWGED